MSHTTVVKTIMALIIIALHMHSSQLLPGAPSARHCLSRTEIRVIAGNRMIKASKKQKKKKKKKTGHLALRPVPIATVATATATEDQGLRLTKERRRYDHQESLAGCP